MRKRYLTLQAQDYPVQYIDGSWIVGRKTPLELFVPESVIAFLTSCSYFNELKLLSRIEHDDKQYRTFYYIRRSEYSGNLNLRICVDTNGDFEYEFENF
jgi:hypothetical protein